MIQAGATARRQKTDAAASITFCAVFLMILKTSALFQKMGQKWLNLLEIIKNGYENRDERPKIMNTW